ncbi:MAG: 1,4-alpha-glucan branching protein GlgB [Pirellulaceae bacterium]
MRTNVSLESIGALIEGRHANPFEILGPHEVEENGRRALAVRAFLPDSQRAWVVDRPHAAPRPMRRIHPSGLFEAICPPPETLQSAPYQLRVIRNDGDTATMHDPYAFPSLLTDYDHYLLAEGTHTRAYDRWGAQIRTVHGVSGVNFCVWAPNASAVSVVGDFNHWDGRTHLMQKHAPSGIWELFVPGLEAGEKYKLRVKSRWGEVVDKSDPVGFAAELPPRTASIVTDFSQYAWGDAPWLQRRQETNPLHQPISIYEVHLGSWRRGEDRMHGWLNYREIAHQLVQYCLDMGYTHVELLPISEHPFTGSWGYQIVGYYAVTSRYGTPEDFMYFVDHCHQNGIGVILDWVPAHFPRDGHGLGRFDGTALYEHEDCRQGEHPDWGTLIFNYGRNEVRNFLIANALFWMDKYHIDGIRADAVASMLYLDYSREEGEWVPNEYGGRENIPAISLLRDMNRLAHAQFPGVLTIAEESTAWGGVSRPTDVGGLGFSLKWNMGWMNDTLRYLRRDSIHRCHHHNELTFSLIYAFTENFALPFSHDEVVHGKRSLLDQMPGDLWQKFANLRALYSYMWTHPGKKLLFMGSDFGQWDEWNCESSLQWDLLQWDTHRGVRRLVADLNALYRREPALYRYDFDGAGFEWIDCHSSADSVLSYIRKGPRPGDFLIVACNFTPVVRHNYHVGTPRGGWYREVLNSDSEHYGGGNIGNCPGVLATEPGAHGRPFALNLTLPPLGVVVFKPQ